MNEVIRDIFQKDFDEAVNKDRQRVARDMLKENLPLSLIKEISKLSESTIRNIAGTLDIPIM